MSVKAGTLYRYPVQKNLVFNHTGEGIAGYAIAGHIAVQDAFLPKKVGACICNSKHTLGPPSSTEPTRGCGEKASGDELSASPPHHLLGG